MGIAPRLLLIALAIAADAHTNATLDPLTLSRDAGSLITTREDPILTASSSNTVIGTAASDSIEITEFSATNTPATPCKSDSGSASTSNSSDQDTSGSATSSPGSASDRNTNDSVAQIDSTTPSAAVSSLSKSSTTFVNSLNDSNGQLSAGRSTGIAAVLPIVFGALACVGALIMAVTYKNKHDVNENDSNRPSPDCEYSGANFFPENRTLSVMQEKSPTIKMPDVGTHDLAASACIVNFLGADSCVSSTSPFGSTRCKVRVSSPDPNSEANMEFQDTGPRKEGSDVILAFNGADISYLRPQVQL